MIENEKSLGKETYKLKRENWDPWDPTLIRLIYFKFRISHNRKKDLLMYNFF